MRRRETPRDDDTRTKRLLDNADAAFNRGVDLGEEFESVLMEGLLTDKAVPVYPPVGHTYPRRG